MPVTAADVIFSWQLLRDHGRPNYRTYYLKVTAATALTARPVPFDLAGNTDRELPLILGLMPILPQHAVDPEHFEETSLAPPLGSGPSVVAEGDAGRSVTFGRYRRTASFFEDSELSARGRPADAAERALLAPFPGAVRDDVLKGTWSPPISDGTGRDRDALRRALALLHDAGYELSGAALRHHGTGAPLAFEILVPDKDQERLAIAFSQNLKRAGIELRLRVVDAVQYEQRRNSFDFDMIQNRWDQSLSPGNAH